MESKVDVALALAFHRGQYDGAHHKAWVIDQMARILLGDGYREWVKEYEAVYQMPWDVGIAP